MSTSSSNCCKTRVVKMFVGCIFAAMRLICLYYIHPTGCINELYIYITYYIFFLIVCVDEKCWICLLIYQEMTTHLFICNDNHIFYIGTTLYISIWLRMTKKSWFANMMGVEREEYRHTITIRNKQLNQVKADIVHAFLSVSSLTLYNHRTLLMCVSMVYCPNEVKFQSHVCALR